MNKLSFAGRTAMILTMRTTQLNKSLCNQLILAVLATCITLLSRGELAAQTFVTLHSFTGTNGGYPNAGLQLSGTTMFGTTRVGGSFGHGTVFAINFDGTGFTNVYNFTGGLDGDNPAASLLLSSNTIYGTTTAGGSWSNGTVFAVNTDGADFTNLHSFTAVTGTTNSDGVNPYDGLILSGNKLYGTTQSDGPHGFGTVFAVNTDGTGFTNLHSFYTHFREGANPLAGLILSGNTLYGTTTAGGSSVDGVVFAVNTDGTGFTNLHSFNGTDGSGPVGGLILSGNTLYGTTQTGGPIGYGTVFALNTDGTGFTNLHGFNQRDGWEPQSSLILSGNTLYGTTAYGGDSTINNGNGTVFAIHTDGTGFATLHSFTGTVGSEGGYGTNSDGGRPVGGVILSSNTIYGTTHIGGSSGAGTVFSISLPISQPQLTITPAAGNVILTWPTLATGFTLQSTTNLGSSAIWTTNLPAPVVVNGQNTVTNPIFDTPQFFRLSQ